MLGSCSPPLRSVRKHFNFTHCILDTKCKRFRGIDSVVPTKGSKNETCAVCGQFISCHALAPKSQEPAVRLFAVVRNTRFLVALILALASRTSLVNISRSLKDLAVDAGAVAQQVKQHGAQWQPAGRKKGRPSGPSMVPEACSELKGAINRVSSAVSTYQSLMRSQEQKSAAYQHLRTACVKALIQFDAAYNWLHYECNSSQGTAIPGALIIPPPHVYFSRLAGPWAQFPDCKIPQALSRFTSDGNSDLLQLFIARWQETELYFGEMSVHPEDLVATGLRASTQHGAEEPRTMKGGDPVCNKLLAQWRESVRTFACRMYAFAVPTAAAIEVLKQHSPLVEIGAGTGYWASLLQKAGGDIVALDSQPTDSGHNEYHGRCKPWTTVKRAPLHAHMQERALFMCYPPPDSNMADVALSQFSGDTVLYVGEWSGDTGTPALQKRLLREWRLAEAVPLPNWGDTCYELMVWRRCSAPTGCGIQQPGGSKLSAKRRKRDASKGVATDCQQGLNESMLMPLGMQCAVCNIEATTERPLWLCRQTCCFAFCSDSCLQRAAGAPKLAAPEHESGNGSHGKVKVHGANNASGSDEHAVRLGSYSSELSLRHCGVPLNALMLSDERLFRLQGSGGGGGGGADVDLTKRQEQNTGGSKTKKRKKKRKR